jgi:hypothetical protein
MENQFKDYILIRILSLHMPDERVADFCTSCGTPNTVKNQFCGKCGASLIKTDNSPTVSQSQNNTNTGNPKKSYQLKTSYAVILIIICVVIAFLGLNGLMKTFAHESSAATSQFEDTKYTSAAYQRVWATLGDSPSTTKNTNPWIGPGVIFIIGLAGIGFGAYSIFVNKRSVPKTVP